jgi:MFS family permease
MNRSEVALQKTGFNSIQFLLLCLSTFLFFASFNMIIPELPSYLTSLGGGEYKGFIIALFTLTAGLSRPFSGKLADKIGRLKVMIFGAIVSGICGMLYSFTATVSAFLFLRFFHGFSTGFNPTGTSAYVADVVRVDKRGEAMGYIGFSSSLGLAGGPAIGSYISMNFSLDHMFFFSSITAIFSVLILSGMKETLPKRQSFHWGLIKLSPKEILEPRVLAPSVVTFLSIFSFGVVLTIIPDFSDSLGISNRGLFFSYFTLASLGVRILAGKLSDRFGRVLVLKFSTIFLAFSMILIGISTSAFMFLFSAVVFGVAVGLNSPTLFAWTIDRSHKNHRGKAMATMYIALEAGIGFGALASGWYFGNNLSKIPATFFVGGFFSFLAFLYLMFKVKKDKEIREDFI